MPGHLFGRGQSLFVVVMLFAVGLAGCDDGGGGGGGGESGPRCGDGLCNGDETWESCSRDCDCEPDCSGRECGPDPVCGQSCGRCDDGNECTADSCDDGRCDYHAMELEPLSCEGDIGLMACVNGERQAINCAQVCVDSDALLVTGCDPATTLCGCMTLTGAPACEPGTRICLESGELVECMEGEGYGVSENFWWMWSCREICIDAGYDVSVGCEYQEDGAPICMCDDLPCQPDCAGRNCGLDPVCGESCGECPDWHTCVEDGSGGHCECADSCRAYPGSSLCCGFPFCSGDCIGNPCCS